MPGPDPDVLVLGSGLAGLTVGALLARCGGRKVRVLEAHEHPGGFGHTFGFGHGDETFKFNAQLHYVWNCGPGRTVDNVLRKLGLGDRVSFEQFDPTGFDHMRMPGYSLDIPYDRDVLIERLAKLFPFGADKCAAFIREVERTEQALDRASDPSGPIDVARGLAKLGLLLRYRNATLQDVFDRFEVPRPAQTLLALQWPDFLLPPRRLSFFAWVLLFMGYCHGAYYPTRHFEHVIDSLVGTIAEAGGEVLLGRRVIEIIVEDGGVRGVVVEHVDARGVPTGETEVHRAAEVISNMDPRKTAELVGLERFSFMVRKRLDYRYSASNFMAYCVVEGIDLREHGFGRWNLFHTEHEDLNETFDAMLLRGDYSRISFAASSPTLLTTGGDAPDGKQILELMTVADYDRFLRLELGDPRAYRATKQAIFDRMLDVLERDYVPNLREHLCFKMTGSPTTNERFVLAPRGNSYGADMTPSQMGPGRPGHRSSIPGLHFCNATAGYPGFAGTIWTGAHLYEALTGDSVHRGPHVRERTG